jgi:pimeloyl-ACP methyl ester carboxylesterase
MAAALAHPGFLLDVGGHRLHAVCSGSGGPGVLLESGIAASSLSWSLVQPRIGEFTRACAYDRAGLAWSDAASTPRTFAHILDDLHALLVHVGMQPAIMVGHSFGSLIVRGYAARFPEDVAGMVLVDPPTEWLAAGRQRDRLLRGAIALSAFGALLARAGIVRALLALLTGGKPGAPRRIVRLLGPTVARTLERIVGEVRKLPPEVHPAVQAHWCEPKCFRAMADYLRVLRDEVEPIAAAIPPRDIPVTVISGAHQSPAEIASHRSLAERSPRGTHVVAAHSGHWVLFDEPEVIVAAVRALVEAARRS